MINNTQDEDPQAHKRPGNTSHADDTVPSSPEIKGIDNDGETDSSKVAALNESEVSSPGHSSSKQDQRTVLGSTNNEDTIVPTPAAASDRLTSSGNLRPGKPDKISQEHKNADLENKEHLQHPEAVAGAQGNTGV